MDQRTPEAEKALLKVDSSQRGFFGRRRNQIMIAIAVGVVLLGAWIVTGRAASVSTSDARIAADIVAVSTTVSGQVMEVYARTGDTVERGDPIYLIDDRADQFLLSEYEAELASLHAQIAREEARLGFAGSKSETQIDARLADTRSANAAVSSAESELSIAKQEYDRAQGLHERKLLSQSAWEQAQNRLESARQTLRMAEASLTSANAEAKTAAIVGDETRLIAQDVEILKAAVKRAEARVARQRVIVDQHLIRSPIDGVVDELFFDAGEHALQGFRVALLHNPDKVWVAANIKETEVRHVVEGAPATIRIDSYPGVKLSGEVELVRQLTTAEAAMMPNPNAGGVFTKITQRIPIRVRLEEAGVILRPGTMVTVRIDRVGDRLPDDGPDT